MGRRHRFVVMERTRDFNSDPVQSYLAVFLILLAMGIAVPGTAKGQTTTGSIFGTVADPTGAAVPGATVTATDAKTGISRTAQTNSSGNYVFPSIPPGDYAISTTAPSFATQTKAGVHVDVNQNVQTSFQIAVGNTAQTVDVSSTEAEIETRESQLGQTVDQKRIEDLPLNGRDVSSLVQLAPGVTAYSAQPAGGNQYGTTFSVNGNRTNEDSFYLDGAFDNSLFITGGNILPNPDALLEFRLLTTSFDAEFGRYPGGVVNVVSRSGGNHFHGLLYDYLRNDALNSKNFFQSTITPLKQNQFGGNFGGPILRNKAFFFGSYEGLRIITPSIISAGSIATPTAAEAGGDFSALPAAQQPNVSCNGVAGVICPDQLDAVAQNLLKQVPLSNTSGSPPQQSAAANTTSNQYLAHLDYTISKAQQLSGSLFQSFSTSANPTDNGNQILSYSGASNAVTQTNVAITDVWTISASKLNTFRPFYTVNHTNESNLYTNNVGWAYYGASTGIGALPLTQPQIAVNGYFSMGMGAGGPDNLHQQEFGAEDTFNWNLGNHSLRLGGAYFWNHYAEQGEYLGTGEATFTGFATGNALADFLEGKAATLRQNNGASHHLHSPAPSLFVQDDWRATQKLTLNLGLRWEVFAPFTGQNNFGTFVPNVESKRFPNAPLGLLTAGDPGVPDGIVGTKYKDFSPRVGFAYDLLGKGKSALRGAYGIFYSARAVSLTTNPEQQPFILDNTITDTPNLVTPYGPNADPFPYTVNLQDPQFLSGATLTSIPLNAGTPYVQEYNLTLEQELFPGWSFSIGYVGSISRKFYLSRDQNAPAYFPGASTQTAALNARRPYQPTPNSYVFGAIVENDPANNASYNSLQISLNRRFAHGFSISANYVWSKSLDLQSGDPSNITLTLEDQNNIGANRGLSDFDVPQRFVASYLYQTPHVRRFGLLGREALGDWQLNGITTLQTGMPFTVFSGIDSNLDTVATDRPNQLLDPRLHGRSREQKINEFFNTAAFAQVPVGVPFGSTGRNSLVGPGIVNTDFSAFKNIPVKNESYFQFRAEFFNLFNNVNLQNPTATLTSPLDGRITSSLPARVLQFALKYSF